MVSVRKGVVDVKRRINVLMDVWHRLLELWEDSGGALVRGDAVKLLSDVYQKESIKPLKGAMNPADIYDKELASLYVVGKHGMALEESYPELFDKIFTEEVKYENAINIMLKEPPERAREKVKAMLGEVDDNIISRIFRLKLTEVFFGFDNKDRLLELIKVALKVYPEKERVIKNYMKFYIAFSVAEAISKKEVRDKIEKEVLKQSLALQLGLDKKKLPDDDYVRTIAMEVFQVSPRVLDSILVKKRVKRRKQKAS
ncbi:MAG: DUF2192 domain-containing protein [Acidilobaceae archaeon]|nr:DUF2192 domain-containing protein [Acidilobaceae archaeon]